MDITIYDKAGIARHVYEDVDSPDRALIGGKYVLRVTRNNRNELVGEVILGDGWCWKQGGGLSIPL